MAKNRAYFERKFGSDRSRRLTGMTDKKASRIVMAWGSVIFLTIAAFPATEIITDRKTEATVLAKIERLNHTSSGKYAYTNAGIFTVNANILRLHFSSIDTFSKLKEGEVAIFKVSGINNPEFNRFPNINEVINSRPIAPRARSTVNVETQPEIER
jgi:hypothetical protein